MSRFQAHLIGRVVLDIETAEPEDEVWTLQEDLSQLMQQRASAEIAALLDQWVNADEVIRLDELILELPPIDYDALTSEFIPRLIEALRDALAARLPQPLARSQTVQDSAFSDLAQSLRPDSSQPLPADSSQSFPQDSSQSLSQASSEEDSSLDAPAPTSQSSFAADWEVLIYFLEYGRLPWWQPSAPFSDWVTAWAAALKSDFAGRASLQQLLAKQPAARQRLITQLPSSFVHTLIAQWQPAWTIWPTLFAQVRALIQFSKANPWQSPALSTATSHYLEQQAQLILCEQLATHTSQNVPFPLRAWLDAWLPIFVKAICQGRGLASAPADSFPQEPAAVEQIDGEQIDGEQMGGGVRSLQTYLHQAISTLKLNNASAWQSAINRHVPAVQPAAQSRTEPSPTSNAAANPDASASGTSSTAQVRNMRQAEETTALQSPDFQARELSSPAQDAVSSLPLNPSINEQSVQPPAPTPPTAASPLDTTSSAAQRPTGSELSSTSADAAPTSPEETPTVPNVAPTTTEADSVESKDYSSDSADYSVESEANSVESEGYLVESEGYLVESEANSVESEDYSVESEANSVESEDYLVESEGYLVESEANSVESEANSVESEANSVESEDYSVESQDDSVESQATSIPSESDVSRLSKDSIEPTSVSEPSLLNESQVGPTQALPNQDLTITPQNPALPSPGLPGVESDPSRINPVLPSEAKTSSSAPQDLSSPPSPQRSSESAQADNAPSEPTPPPVSSAHPVKDDEIRSSSPSETDTSETDTSETDTFAASVDGESILSHPLMTNPPKRAISPNLSRDEIANGIYLNNAGLVLLHPFLKIYFDDIGLLAEDDFVSEYEQQQAIALLHYLATGQTNAPEYDLVLPKLLCGWPLNDPVAEDLQLPPSALAEGEKLLQAVINYWDALKNTTADGLREGFIRRQGKLTYTDDWKLRVEQQAIDILLSRLPWGISMVKLPWMPTVLVVEWT